MEIHDDEENIEEVSNIRSELCFKVCLVSYRNRAVKFETEGLTYSLI